MLSTAIVVVLFLGLLIASFVLWAVFLRLGLRWAKVEHITTRRVVWATAIVFAVQLLSTVLSHLPMLSADAQIILVALVRLAAAVLFPCLIVAHIFQSRLLRSLQAWVPTLVPSIATNVLVLLIVRPFLVDTFVVPTNAMAPTLLGNHLRGICPECGRASFATPPPFPTRNRSSEPLPMICESFHVSQGADLADRAFTGDRFLVAKYLMPRRWDLVVFRSPRDPSALSVKRLVGLPGEEIRIDDGAVWANGIKLRPPEPIRGIRYLSELPPGQAQVWGSVDRPAKLAADEYFVLGDFSTQSEDSRFWRYGAPGHSPFAVPESHVCGVVTHVYWPPQRWRILR